MKHRSVIAFVIVAAALFAAPQLSHDLQTFKSALGSRLRGELMHAFLSLPAGETGTTAVVASAPAEMQLASCSKARPAAKQRKSDPAPPARAGLREAAGGEWAMIGEPVQVSEPWAAALLEGPQAVETPHKALGELAMIIPPDSGIEPRGLARVAADAEAGVKDAVEARRLSRLVRMAYVSTRPDAKGFEWRRVEGALRGLEESLPGGAMEFRLEREGTKTKVLKVKQGTAVCCPPRPAPRAPRPAGVDAAAAPLPAVEVVTALVSE